MDINPSRIPLRSWAAAVLLLCCSGSLRAEPDVTAEEARAFLGGRTGKVVYLRNFNSQLYYIDLSDSTLRERPIAADAYCNSPMIHPDGTRIVYESLGGIHIRDLAENSATRSTILSAPIKGGYFYEPRWWLDPQTGDEYIIYTTGYLEEHEWPQKSGQTYIQKIVDNKASGAARMLLPFMMGGGRSHDGLWGATSNHTTGMFKFVPGKVDSAFYGLRNWMDEGFFLGCNPAISPSKDPARQSRMMHLSSGQGGYGGKIYDNHKAVFIRSWDDESVNHALWYIGPPGDNSNDDGSGNLYWNFPEWSNDEHYFTLTGSKEIDIVSEADLYFVRINYGAPNRILRIMKGGSKFYYPHLWIQDGQLPARIRLGLDSLGFSALKRDTANPPPQTISVSNAGAGTLPSLQVGPTPGWLEVGISGNGTNDPVLTHTVFRDSVQPGEHKARVTVSFGSGVDSQTYVVTFRLSDPVFTSLRPAAATAVLTAGDTLRLAAIALDQTGRPMSPQPAVSWKGSPGLDLSSDGLVRADSVPWAARMAIASSGTVSCTTLVHVARRHLKIDAGADDSLMGWLGDGDFSEGNPAYSWQDADFDLSGAANAAPASVYRTYRMPAPAYRFPSLPNGRYRVRLHFSSPDSGAAGQIGAMTVMVHGIKVLENYLPPSRTAEGPRGDTREFSVTVANSRGMEILFNAAAGKTAVSGIEVFDEGVPPILVTSPNGGERFSVGDTVPIRWESDSLVTSIGIKVSLDSGKTWLAVTRRKSVQLGEPEWQNFGWIVPDSLDGFSLVSNRAMVSVYDYFGVDRDQSDTAFSVLSSSAAVRPSGPRGAAVASIGRFDGARLRISLPEPGKHTLSLTDMRGRNLRTADFAGGGNGFWEVGPLPRGLYQVRIRSQGGARSILLPVY